MRKRQHLLPRQSTLRRVGHGHSIWLTLFDRVCMAGLLDINAKHFSVMDESIQFYMLNTLVGTPVSLTIKKSK